jgi:hypothetical protein
MTTSRIYRLVPLIAIALAVFAGLVVAARPAAAAPGPPDLSVTMTASPNPVAPNGYITYALKVYNTPTERCEVYRGEDRCIFYGRNLSGVVVDFAVPVGARYWYATADHGFSCAAQSAALVRCVNGSLLMDDQATITIRLWPPYQGGTITATATVDPANAIAERSETNNAASVAVTVNPPSPTDLAVTSLTATPNPVSRASTVTFTVTVSNVSGVAASGVSLSLRGVPATMALHFVYGAADGNPNWACYQKQGDPYFNVVCDPPMEGPGGYVPAGGNQTFTITATTGPNSGNIGLQADVGLNWAGGYIDSNSSNNSRGLTLAVQ